MGIVRLVMKRYIWVTYGNGAFDEDDLLQAGRRGLIMASEKFDVSKGWKFITFAAKCVDTEMIKEIDWTSRLVRVPASSRRILFKQGKPVRVRCSVSLETGFPGHGDGNDSMSSPSNPLNKMVADHYFPSLAEADQDEQNAELIKSLKWVLINNFRGQARNLDINMRVWFKGETLAQAGRAHGVSRERARQIAARGKEAMQVYKRRRDARARREDAEI